MKYLSTAILVTMLFFIACEDEKGDAKLDCDQTARISASEYPTAPDDPVTIEEVMINKNCLNFRYTATACNGNTWAVELIDSGDVMESQPPRRDIVFVLHNDEECDAIVTKEVSFDVSPLQVDGNSVILILQNTGEEVLYQY